MYMYILYTRAVLCTSERKITVTIYIATQTSTSFQTKSGICYTDMHFGCIEDQATNIHRTLFARAPRVTDKSMAHNLRQA